MPFPGFIFSRCGLACALFGAVGVVSAQDLPKDSPFLPPGTATADAAVSSKYQLGGMIVKGKDILISITRLSDKQSFWIPLGGTVNEVTALSYNSDQDEARVRANGETLTLPLRKPAISAGAVLAGAGRPSGFTPSLSGPVAITPPLPSLASASPEVQEREARMLVTDLLDIGQQQRKAYEEAQRKAAAEKR